MKNTPSIKFPAVFIKINEARSMGLYCKRIWKETGQHGAYEDFQELKHKCLNRN
jgi:hypothetical protein